MRAVDIIVAPIVLEELDKFKIDRERRRRDRARRALSLIERASNEPDFRIVLKDKPVQVSLRVSIGPRVDWDAWPHLDQSRPDDQLVATALSEQSETPSALLSFDTGPLIRARIAGLPAHKSPESWQLPEQPDEAAQEMARLKRELASALATRPAVAVSFLQGGTPSQTLKFRIPALPPLPSDLKQALMQDLTQLNPKHRLKATSPGLHTLSYPFAQGHSKHTVERYDQDYRGFLAQGSKFFDELHERIARACRVIKVPYRIENASNVTANNLLIGFEGPQEFVTIADRQDIDLWGGVVTLPKPPERPKTTQEELFSPPDSLMHSFIAAQEQQRDPTGFYWQDRPNGTTQSASLICAEFRAKRERSASFSLYLTSKPTNEAAVNLEVTANNLPEPVRTHASIWLYKEEASWIDDDVLALLDGWIADRLRAG